MIRHVTITVNMDITVSGKETDKDLKREAWFQLFDNNDPSNWPEGTDFKFGEPEDDDRG